MGKPVHTRSRGEALMNLFSRLAQLLDFGYGRESRRTSARPAQRSIHTAADASLATERLRESSIFNSKCREKKDVRE